MIVVAGEVLVDLVVSADGGVDARLGGGPYNTARTLARLGAATTFFGGLADDRFGRLLRGALDAEGVAIGVPAPSAAPTTLALVDLDQAGVASYAFYLTGTAAADLDYPPLAAAFAAILAEARAPAPPTLLAPTRLPPTRPPRPTRRRGGRRPRRRPRPGDGADRLGRRAAGAGRRPAGRPGDARPQLPPRRHRRPGGLPGAHRAHRGPGRRGQGKRGRPRLPLPGLAAGRGRRVAAGRRARRSSSSPTAPARPGRSCPARSWPSRSPPSRSWTRSAPATPSAAASSPGGRRTASPGPT